MSTASGLVEQLLRGRAVTPSEQEALERALPVLVARARDAWPAFEVAELDFVAAIAARLPEDEPPFAALLSVCADDLYLACACARGDPAALAAFEARYAPEVEAAVRRARLPGVAPDEIAQIVRTQLLVGDEKGPPRIEQYQGRGSLSGWLRVVAVRHSLMALRSRRNEVAVQDDHLADLAEDDTDPELAYLKGLYADDFRAAFREGLACLESRARNLLRYHYLERVTLDRLAAMYQVHRVTISRWLVEARERVFEETVASLRRRIGVSESEFQSLVVLMQSRIDLSVRLLMKDP